MRKALYLLIFTAMLTSCSRGTSEQTSPKTHQNVECSADSLYEFVRVQTSFGPRVPNTKAHSQCENYIASTFERYGCAVELQKADIVAHNGVTLHTTNIIASLYPQKKGRIFIAAHYDSRPWADEDESEQKALEPVMGANDGASGVAVMLEMARVLSQDTTLKYGVDFVCFDSEDYGVSSADDSYCLGSQYWAKQALKNRYSALYGVLLDMVGAPDAKFFREAVSDYYAKDIVSKVWGVAATLGYSNYFIDKPSGAITDDHLYVNKIAGIPCIDIIDFDSQRGFPPSWHTSNDVIENISSQTLSAVCTVLCELF